MSDILKRAAQQVIVVDGAMGTMLQRMGLAPGDSPELLNVTAPEMIAEVHSLYITGGALAISTNTFGGSRPKLADWHLGDQVVEINRAAVRIARQAGAQHILADVGPTGLVMEPMGPATYDEVYAAFTEQIGALASMDPDAIFLETFTDLAEARVALLAAREVCDLPVFVSMSYGTSGRTDLSGTDPATAAVVLEACGASAVGMNCGLGPEQMLPLVERLVAATSLPVIVQPNAGMPRLVDGTTIFPGTPDELADYAVRFADLGAAFVGSCCGSTPAFTGAIAFAVGDRRPVTHGPAVGRGVTLASARATRRIGSGEPLAIIGERINPTGKKALAESLRAGSMSIVRDFAVAQQGAGADLLDVNVGAAGVDATTALPLAVSTLVPLTDLPLVIDTTDGLALEAALRVYPGRALINSVNGGEESIATVLPLAARYGAAVIILALDDDGIPATVPGRVAIVERVRAAAHKAGLTDEDLMVDALVMTAAAEPGSPMVTLDAVRAVSGELGLTTVLGVSNVSHGLPGRPDLNAAFLELARGAGLDAAIFDPSAPREGGSQAAYDVLLGRDERYERWLAAAGTGTQSAASAIGATSTPSDPAERLGRAIDNGDADAAPGLVDDLIDDGMSPSATIGAVMTPAIQRLGDAYGRGEVFLPQMMAAASAMKAGVDRAKERMGPGEVVAIGSVVFATVKGDIHSIGKDICVSLLESQGFEVVDLGVDVATETVVERSVDADAVCLSALMTTTLPAMEATVRALKSARPDRPVFVGGAVVTPEWARSVGADGYAPDAPGCVEAVRSRMDEGSS